MRKKRSCHCHSTSRYLNRSSSSKNHCWKTNWSSKNHCWKTKTRVLGASPSFSFSCPSCPAGAFAAQDHETANCAWARPAGGRARAHDADRAPLLSAGAGA